MPVPEIRKVCIANAKNKKNLQCKCKNWKEYALHMQKIKIKFAFPVQGIKKNFAHAKNKKKLHCPCKDYM